MMLHQNLVFKDLVSYSMEYRAMFHTDCIQATNMNEFKKDTTAMC